MSFLRKICIIPVIRLVICLICITNIHCVLAFPFNCFLSCHFNLICCKDYLRLERTINYLLSSAVHSLNYELHRGALLVLACQFSFTQRIN